MVQQSLIPLLISKKNYQNIKILTVPTIGYKKPAPIDALTSLIGNRNPTGAPLMLGSDVSDRWVFAIQIGKSLKP